MTTKADAHQARIVELRNDHGYTTGYTYECACGHNGVDVHPRREGAGRELHAHLLVIGLTPQPKERTT